MKGIVQHPTTNLWYVKGKLLREANFIPLFPNVCKFLKETYIFRDSLLRDSFASTHCQRASRFHCNFKLWTSIPQNVQAVTEESYT